jgi:hypothetical protein
MMDKYPLTSGGISTLQEQLYGLSDDELLTEAEVLAADPRAWIAGHLELEVRQLECLRSIQEDFIQMFGWNIAAAVLGRRPITLSYRADESGNKSDTESCILYNCRVSSHFADGIVTSTGSLDIVVTE